MSSILNSIATRANTKYCFFKIWREKYFIFFTWAIYGIFILFSTVFLFYFILFAQAIYLDDQNKHRTKQGKQGKQGREGMTMAMMETNVEKTHNNQQIEKKTTKRREEMNKRK